MKSENLRMIYRGLAVWLLIVGAESLHGTARVIFLQPVLGDFRARQISVLTGMLIIFAISFWTVSWLSVKNKRQMLTVGAIWVVLTVLFEITLGRLMNLSWQRILSDYDLANGGLMGFGLLFMLFAPLIAAKIRKTAARKPRIADL
jgi:hypothetical protein